MAGKQMKKKPATPAGPSLGARISDWFREKLSKKADPQPKSKQKQTDRLTPS